MVTLVCYFTFSNVLVQVKKLKVDEAAQKIEVYAKDVEPKDSFGTMALTQPFCVIRTKKPSFDLQKEYKIHWMKKKKSVTAEEGEQ